MRIKKTIIILLFGYSFLQAQFFIPGAKTRFGYLCHEYYHDGILDLIIDESTVSLGSKIKKKISINLETGTYESKLIFDSEFYKNHKTHKLFFYEYHQEYVICIGKPNYVPDFFNRGSYTERITKIGYFIYNTVKDEYFDFLIEVDDNTKLIEMDYIIEDFNGKSKELVIFTQESDKDAIAFDGYDFNALYKTRRVNLETKEVTTSTFNLSEKDIAIVKVFSLEDPKHCFVRYMKKKDKTGFRYDGWDVSPGLDGCRYALLDLNTGQMTPVDLQSSKKIIDDEDQIQTKEGLIISIVLGNSSQGKEVMVVEVSNDGIVTELTTEVYSSKYETNRSYLAYGSSINLKGKFYRYHFDDDKFFLLQMDRDKVIINEYDLGTETSGVSMIDLDDEHIEFYADNASTEKGKKTKIIYSFLEDRIYIEELDDKYVQPYQVSSYERNGTTIPYFYKWDKTGLTVDQQLKN
jgi:hypothetical protein